MSENVTKWKKTGLLDGLSPDTALKCADSLETLADLLIGQLNPMVEEINKTFGDGFLPGLILPIVVRLYMEKATIPDMEWLCYDFMKYAKIELPKLQEKQKEEGNSGLDVEAELCSGYVEQFEKE